MTFDNVTGDGRLWAVKYDGESQNVLYSLFGQWSNIGFLREFFKENFDDLSSYFRITNINKAIFDTVEDNDKLQCLILDISPDADLDRLFRPLENFRTSDVILGKEKAKLRGSNGHSSWLRIYAIKLTTGVYIVTGGAIKLTATMQEREHTLNELSRMECVRQFLLDENIIDDESFIEYLSEV